MIRALIETSLIDWDGKLTTVVFFDKCNFMCPFCQNWDLILNPEKFPEIKWEEIENKLDKKRGWIDGVVLTGGEPLVYKKEAIDLCKKIKKLGLKVKLDTNGAFPRALEELIEQNLLDYVAMDVKAPLNQAYFKAAGKKINLEHIKDSIEILKNNRVDYEFRTTCVPGIIDKNAITKIGEEIKGAKKWALQAFIPGNAYKEEYRKELNSDYPKNLKEYLEIARGYVANTILRAKI